MTKPSAAATASPRSTRRSASTFASGQFVTLASVGDYAKDAVRLNEPLL